MELGEKSSGVATQNSKRVHGIKKEKIFETFLNSKPRQPYTDEIIGTSEQILHQIRVIIYDKNS